MIAVCLFGCVLVQAIKNPCCGTCTYKNWVMFVGYLCFDVSILEQEWLPKIGWSERVQETQPFLYYIYNYIMYIVGKRTWSMVFPTWTALLQGNLGHLQKIVFSLHGLSQISHDIPLDPQAVNLKIANLDFCKRVAGCKSCAPMGPVRSPGYDFLIDRHMGYIYICRTGFNEY